MDELPRQKLKLIISQYGVTLHDDPKRCEALLRDFCGEYRKEISLLINAQKEKVPSELLTSQNSSLPVNLTIARLSKRLEDDLAITSEAAKWSVESWALALNIITEEKTVTEKPVSTPPVPSPLNPQDNSSTSDTENSVLPSSTKQAGILSSKKVRRLLLISAVLYLLTLILSQSGMLIIGVIFYSPIIASVACVVFLGRTKSAALWRRIIMWIVELDKRI